MKVVIIGDGAVGSVLAKLLMKEKEVSKIFCLDLKFANKRKHKKIVYKVFNILKKRKFVEYLNDIKPNVVINASLPNFNLSVMECCLKANVNYMDTASFWDFHPDPKSKIPYKMEQLDFDRKFAKNNLIGLIEAGVAPGLDNLMAAECASMLDEVDYIKIRIAEDTGSKEIFSSWNEDWLLDELNWKPLVYENGKFFLVDNFGGEEEYEFPAPIGKRKTHYFAQDEVGSIPLHIKTKKLDVKIFDNNIEVSRLLYVLGLVSEEEIEVDGKKIKPVRLLAKLLPDPVPGGEKKFPEAIFAMSVEAIGRKNGVKKVAKYSVVFPKQKEIGNLGIGANFISYPTALSVKLFVTELNKIKRIGVFPPECLDKEIRDSILNQIQKNHVKVYKKFYTLRD